MKNNSKKENRGFYRPEVINKLASAFKAARLQLEAGENFKANISAQNSKMGPVASVSTLPFITCPEACNNTCGRICYAAKIANIYTTVRESYAKNTALAYYRRDQYFQDINDYCAGCRFFRWHVSGDIIDFDYFVKMAEVARNNPHCDFLAFTKRFLVVNKYVRENGGSIAAAIPENLHIFFSDCAGIEVFNPYNFPSTMIIETADQFDENTMKYCGGNCFNCACHSSNCWKAAAGDIIAFKKH